MPRGLALTRAGVAALMAGAAMSMAAARGGDPPSKPGAAGAPAPADAAASRPALVIFDRSLGVIGAKELSRVDANVVEYIDAAGASASQPRANVLAIAPGDWWAIGEVAPRAPRPLAKEPPALMELVDGSRLYGEPVIEKPAAGDKGDDTIAWHQQIVGKVTTKLDRVRRLAFVGMSNTAPAPSAPVVITAGSGTAAKDTGKDSMRLVNGDRLEGFFSGLSLDKEPMATMEVDGQSRSTPISRVREVLLVNPPAAPAPMRVWLEDGSIVPGMAAVGANAGVVTMRVGWFAAKAAGADDAGHAQGKGGAAKPAVDGGSTDIPVAAVRAMVMDSARVRPLAMMSILQQTPSADRRWSPPVMLAGSPDAPLAAMDVELPGPGVYEWSLPERATHIAGSLVLPEACRSWGDCTLVLSVVDGAKDAAPRELTRAHLSGETPEIPLKADFAATAAGARLRATLEEGPYGPIQDRVILARVLVAGE